MSSLSATFRKILSPQMMGVAPLQLGSGSFQATFSCGLHFEGRFFSWLTPFNSGPRHCGQFSALAEKKVRAARPVIRMLRYKPIRFHRSPSYSEAYFCHGLKHKLVSGPVARRSSAQIERHERVTVAEIQATAG